MPEDNKRKTSVAGAGNAARLSVALVGQQNCGKSTLFNALTGLSQHVANYPGVTIDKKSATVRQGSLNIELIDLPGAYNLTSFSPEERVTRDFLLGGEADIVINVLDASNLKRGLHLTLQILEAGFRTFVVVNMIDVAESLGQKIDTEKLSEILGVPVIPAIARKGVGSAQIRKAIQEMADSRFGNPDIQKPLRIDYGILEPALRDIESRLGDSKISFAPASDRWMAVKLVEGDPGAASSVRIIRKDAETLLTEVKALSWACITEEDMTPADYIVDGRSRLIDSILAQCIIHPDEKKVSLSERLDKVLLNRWLAPFFLIATVWIIYEISIVQGEELSEYTWSWLVSLRSMIAGWLPGAGFLHDPELRSFGLWLTDSVNTLLTYIPIFLILFTLIAIIEDSGYMARIAFILDRILHRFGLHGQSTLPFILAGVFAGGCAVPGVMATKGIPDNRARMATILTVPFMNCLAKIPLYVLLVNIYFAEDKGLAMFFLSTVTVLFALLIAKLLTVTVLRASETAPFVMELPHYHAPTFAGVARRAIDRTWLYVKKVGTVVLAVAAIVYVLLQYPGLPEERVRDYEQRGETAISRFFTEMNGNPFAARIPDQKTLVDVLNIAVATGVAAPELQDEEKASDALAQEEIAARYPGFAPFLVGGKDMAEQQAYSAFTRLANERRQLRQDMRQERVVNSVLGSVGRFLEPVTRYAGFDWKINVALLSSFAARENSVATLGVLFSQPDGGDMRLEQRMEQEQKAIGYPAMTALGLLLFFALYPPCLATMIMVKIQTGSYRWMVFAIIFPTALGLLVSSLVVTIGNASGLSATEMMIAFYCCVWLLFLTVGLWPRGKERGRRPTRMGGISNA